MNHRPVTYRMPLARQSGIVMILALISLVILALASVALVYSSDTTLINAGNLALKRDLTNQSERVVAAVKSTFTSGALNSTAALENDQVGQNYSAAMLPSKNNGIPTVLLDDLSFVAKYGRSNDIIDSGSGVTLRYVVDRMCRNNGQFDPQSCTTGTKIADKDSSNFLKKPPSTRTPVYRITMRVNGPRNTQSFIQSKVSYNPP